MLNAWAGPRILSGDFNCTPAELERTGWLELVDGVVHAPTTATSCSRVIDFFVVARRFSHAVKGVDVVEDTSSFPHKAVRLLVSSCPRQDVVRELRKIPKFEARQPYGPMSKRHYQAAAESPLLLSDPRGAMAAAWSSYGGIIKELEDQLCEVNGCDSKESKAQPSGLAMPHIESNPAGGRQGWPQNKSSHQCMETRQQVAKDNGIEQGPELTREGLVEAVALRAPTRGQ